MTKKKRNRKRKLSFAWTLLIAISLSAWVAIAFLKTGPIGYYSDNFFNVLFGDSRFLFYGIAILSSVYKVVFRKARPLPLKFKLISTTSIILILLWVSYFEITSTEVGLVFLNAWIKNAWSMFTTPTSSTGGLFGVLLYTLFSALLGRLGTLIVLISSTLILIILSIEFKRLKRWFTQDERDDEGHDDDESMESDSAHFMTADEPKRSVRRKTKEKDEELPRTHSAATIHTIGNYSLPPLSLLDDVVTKSKSNANSLAAHQKGKRLIEILNEFGVNASLVATHIGPSVTKFEVKPDSNVKISKIASIQDNIKMELAAKELRIEAPIPGRSAVGVEIPNMETTPVRMIEMMRDVPSDRYEKKLLYPIGKDLMGKNVFSELDKMPHLLVAGATGSGKSVFVNGMIVNYLLRTSPDELKLLLVDPKKVEFSSFVAVPHLIAPVISDSAEAARALKIIVSMMENRYEVFSNIGVRNIQTYNEFVAKNAKDGLEPMPWIVVIIDELADLMVVAGKEVESSIQRITQLARAAGIHLVVATQRPSTDVITGIIKANIPSRIAFAVSNGIDSRTILDHVGAERLLGKGDMLFYPVGEPAPIRVQGAYISDDEVRRVAEAVAAKQKPNFDEAFLNLSDPEAGSGLAAKIDDPMYEEVKEYVIETGRASTSNLQRRFGLGYNRAARMIDNLEKEGIVGPAMGSKPRDVYKHN